MLFFSILEFVFLFVHTGYILFPRITIVVFSPQHPTRVEIDVEAIFSVLIVNGLFSYTVYKFMSNLVSRLFLLLFHLTSH